MACDVNSHKLPNHSSFLLQAATLPKSCFHNIEGLSKGIFVVICVVGKRFAIMIREYSKYMRDSLNGVKQEV